MILKIWRGSCLVAQPLVADLASVYLRNHCICKFHLLRLEIPSGMCAKLRTVVASNNRDHARNLSSRTLAIMFDRSHFNINRASTSQSLLLLLARATYIMVLFFTHIPFVVNHTINATPPERLQHNLDQTFLLTG